MSDEFIGEMRMFGFNFPPRGWAFCNGQLMSISQNTALFSILGTSFGGDGRTNFALPDLQGATPMGTGQGPGLSPRSLGENGGTETVTLLTSEMPSHNHGFRPSAEAADLNTPSPVRSYAKGSANTYQSNTTANLVGLNAKAVGITGGSSPHNNIQPSLALNFSIALQGIYPQRP